MRVGRLGRATGLVLASIVAGVGGVLVTTAGTAQAYGTGRVCMFNATEGAFTAGHVGFAFRVGPADDWIYGATESPTYNWWAETNQATMINRFKSQGGAGYYDSFRCRDTGNSSVGSAKNKMLALFGQRYDVGANNCLTRSVEIFWAYDISLGDLWGAAGTGPNFYYDNYLFGFGPRAYLH